MMAKYALLLLLFIPVVLQKAITGKVIHVIDGDTIEILYEGKPLRIRLNGIDCPEKYQPFGTAPIKKLHAYVLVQPSLLYSTKKITITAFSEMYCYPTEKY